MNNETLLILILAILVVFLTLLLVTRVRRDRIRLNALRYTNIAEFQDILRRSTSESEIQAVINDATNLLLRSFGCDRLYYFRRDKDALQVTVSQGSEKLHSDADRIPVADRLIEFLQDTPSPISLSEPSLKVLLPPALYQHLQRQNYRLLLPLWWREELSGLFFVGTFSDESESGLSLLLTGLALALGGATSAPDVEESSSPEVGGKVATDFETPRIPQRMIELIEHREPRTLVGKLIETVRDHLQLEQFAYLYETGEEKTPLRVIQDESTVPLLIPGMDEFRLLAKYVDARKEGEPVGIPLFAGAQTDESKEREETSFECALSTELRQAGYSFIVSFPQSTDRAGLLAWDGSHSPVDIARSLRLLNETGTVLVRNAESFQRIEELSYTDNLTGVANRRYFLRRLREEIERAGRYRRSLGLIIFDLDELKQINDSYGHQAGDYVIKRMGATLRGSVRAIDVIARYGGDEFCVIMPEADSDTCRRSMSRLVRNISSSRFEIGQAGSLVTSTVSAGGALFPEHAEDSEGLIYAADMALLQAKEGGRNRSLLYRSQ